MDRRVKTALCLAMALLVALALAACNRKQAAPEEEPTKEPIEWGATQEAGAKPAIPEGVELEDGAPVFVVYVADKKDYERMGIEEYVAGVLAGEMRNDWPMEALKAQAVLARTFTMKFLSEKESKYAGADISTDVTEAQAYDAASVNERVERAVEETRGMVMSYDGEFPYAWFHAHSGGSTELASVGLEYKSDPGYIAAVDSQESDKAPTSVKSWTAEFSADEVAKAAAATGARIKSLTSIAIGEKGDSGRAKTFLINGDSVSAPAMRLQLGASQLKSTLLKSVSFEDGKVTFTGSGYGHGVGMSQWGAYGMAEQGSTYEQIIGKYFKGISLVSLWQ